MNTMTMIGHGMGWGMDAVWILGLVVFLVIIWIVNRSIYTHTYPHHHIEHRSAIDILKERYAHGEIDKDEFEQRKKDML